MLNSDELYKKWLRQTSDKFSIVIHENNDHQLFQSARHVLNKFQCCGYDPIYIALCYHNQDYDEIEGRLEFPHYQCVILFPRKITIKKVLEMLLHEFTWCNESQFGIEKCADLGEISRYILHTGYPDKHPYTLSELETNDIDIFMRYYNLTEIKDIFDCVTIVKQYHYNLEEIITHVSNYKMYKSIIKDLIQNERFRKY